MEIGRWKSFSLSGQKNQKIDEIALGDLCGKMCFVYIYEIILYSHIINEHMEELKTVINKL